MWTFEDLSKMKLELEIVIGLNLYRYICIYIVCRKDPGPSLQSTCIYLYGLPIGSLKGLERVMIYFACMLINTYSGNQ